MTLIDHLIDARAILWTHTVPLALPLWYSLLTNYLNGWMCDVQREVDSAELLAYAPRE